MDEMVLTVQKWVNKTYSGRVGYETISENGKTGWSTMYALTRALQIELGIATPVDNFGSGTEAAYKAWGEMEYGKVPTTQKGKNIVQILQGACYCKGYNPGGFDGNFGQTTKAAVQKLQTDAGLPVTDGKVYSYIFKAFLTMDAYVLIAGGDSKIRTIQRNLNHNYYKTVGVMPCDGYYSRSTNKALIYALQIEEGGFTPNGTFGPTTKSKCPTLSIGDSRANFVKLLQYALYVNRYDAGNMNGVFDSNTKLAVSNFQSFAALPSTGTADMPTWASLLVSTGDTARKGTAADCATTITLDKAKALKSDGRTVVGRYLTGPYALTSNELDIIYGQGLNVFPIYERNATYAKYFTRNQGAQDAQTAIEAATKFQFPLGTIVYFAVDYDAIDDEVTNYIIPYFESINETVNNFYPNMYKIGIYGPRNICSRVAGNNLSKSSFVCDMSTGFSGNLGFPLPIDWAFDQISTVSIGSGSGNIAIDNNISSGRNAGSSKKDTSVKVPSNPFVSQNNKYFNQLDQIYQIALDFTGSTSSANDALTDYFRQPKYDNPLFLALNGTVNKDVVTLVDNKLNNPEKENYYDLDTKTLMDVQHAAATLNTILNRNAVNHVFSDIGGWGGDLLTVTGNSLQQKEDGLYNSVYDAAFNLIGSNLDNGSSFGLADLLADVDMVNIAALIINGTVKEVPKAIRGYYSSETLSKDRFLSFVNNRFNGNVNNIYSVAYEFLTTGVAPMDIVQLYLVSHPYNDDDAKQVAQAFQDVISNRIQ